MDINDLGDFPLTQEQLLPQGVLENLIENCGPIGSSNIDLNNILTL